jgi:hypothetical protein
MCNYWSGIVTENLEVLWLQENPVDHQAVIDKYKLGKEISETMRAFVRVEISPLEISSKLTRNREDWRFTVDINDNDCLPKWFKANRKKIEGLCWKAWMESVVKQVILDGEVVERLDGNDYVAFMVGNAKVEEMWDSSVVEAMYGSSVVEAMRDSSVVKAMRNSSVVEAMWDSSVVEAMWDSSVVKAMWGSSVVKAMWNSSVVKAMRNSSVVKAMYDSSVVKAMWDSSVARKNGVTHVSKNAVVNADGKVEA